MARDRDALSEQGDREEENEVDRNPKPKSTLRDDRKSKRRVEYSGSDRTDSSSESDDDRRHRRKRKRRSSRRSYSDSGSDLDSELDSGSGSESESGSGSESEESEDERRRRKRRERRKREEREREKRKREKERKKRKREKEDEKRRKKKKEKEKEKEKKREKEKGKTGAVTNSWGKYGVIREIDMWNKRPEFTAWLAEVKQVNLESLPNWEEKKMFKEYMEDYNTATFPSKKYYNLDAYHRHKMEKEMKKGFKKIVATERTVFNDEEQRRQELMQAREKQKEQEVEVLKDAMKSGMAQAMIEQARLREEMAYLYKIGNSEAAAAIQRKLDPDVAM